MTQADQSSHRQHATLDMLRQLGGSSRTADLAAALAVSEETVRRNIKRLAGQGQVVRVHGGVFLAAQDGEPAFRARLETNRGEKRRIGRAVAGLIGNGATLFLDSSTTSIYVAEALADHHDLTIITNALEIAWRLGRGGRNRVLMAGGEIRALDGASYGAEALGFLRGYAPDFAVLSVAGFGAAGFLQFDQAEVDIGRVMLAQSRTRIVMADHSKFKRSAPIVLCPPRQIDVFVTDEVPPSDLSAVLVDWGIGVHLAPQRKKDKK